MTLFVIPDIHGHLDKLTQKVALIDAHYGPDAPIVFLGDYTDRGPDSRGVLQYLIDGSLAGRDWIFLRGNHDQMFLDFLAAYPDTPPSRREDIRWLSYRSGGLETLASYGLTGLEDAVMIAAAIPEAHRAFLDRTKLLHETDDLVFAHAGIMPGVPLADQTPLDLMWIREPFHSDPRDHGKLVVHGHTPVDFPTHFGNRVALDGGAGWGRDLHVAMFEGREGWLLTGAGRVPFASGQN